MAKWPRLITSVSCTGPRKAVAELPSCFRDRIRPTALPVAKYDLADLKFVDVLSTGVERPTHTVAGHRTNRLVAVLHDDHAICVIHVFRPPWRDAKLAFTVRERVDIDRSEDARVWMRAEVEHACRRSGEHRGLCVAIGQGSKWLGLRRRRWHRSGGHAVRRWRLLARLFFFFLQPLNAHSPRASMQARAQRIVLDSFTPSTPRVTANRPTLLPKVSRLPYRKGNLKT